MSESYKQMNEILAVSPLIPVLVIDDLTTVIPLAKALYAGGIKVMEVTLRSDIAMSAISLILKECPEMQVGAGTVVNEEQLHELKSMGAHFAISPGITRKLLESSASLELPLLPGVSNVSDILLGLEYQLDVFKFFPAEASGGVQTLKAFLGPFPHIKFCPTGGVTKSNMHDYFALPNVVAVGGSWLAPKELLKNSQWQDITHLAKEALKPISESSM